MNNSTGDRHSPLGLFPRQPTPRLYDRVVEVLRTRHYSRRTEEAYIHWIRRFILFHAGMQPRDVAESDVNRFLTHLAVKENVAASTQKQALAALLFLYEHVLGQPLKRIEGVVRARKPVRLALQDHLRRVRQQHEADLERGLAGAAAERPGPEVPLRRPRVGLAVGVPCFVLLPRS